MLLLTVALKGYSSVYSQNDVVNLSKKDTPLREIFREIEKQTKFSFIYNDEYPDLNTHVTVNFIETKINHVLDNLLLSTGLTYRLMDESLIVITPREKAQQPFVVKGCVTDLMNEPLEGTAVMIKGTNLGVYTGSEGKYVIKVPSPNVLLVFSYSGYITEEVSVDSCDYINVTLIEDIKSLQEVVVTGYQTISKERATGAYETVNSESLEKRVSRNILTKIRNETTGIRWQGNNREENGSGLTIRGETTFGRNAKPLIVVDGFPLDRTFDINTINPNDVERITILKDASAASVWGARSAMGVIVIETKKGKASKKTNVSFSTNFTITPLPKRSDFDWADNASLFEYYRDMVDNSRWYTPLVEDGYYSDNYAYNEMIDTYLKLREGYITQEEADAVENRLLNIDSYDEFKKLFLQSGIMQNYNLSLSGGNEKLTYYFSSLYTRNRGNSINNNSNSLNFNLKVDARLTKWLKMNASVSMQNDWRKDNGIEMSELTSLPQFQKILDENGKYIWQPKDYYSPFKDGLVAQGFPYPWGYNLMQEFENKNNKTKAISLRPQISFTVKILEGLNFETTLLHERAYSKTENIYNENTYKTRNHINFFSYFDDEGVLHSPMKRGGIYEMSDAGLNAITSRNMLRYSRDFFDGKHSISAIAGMEIKRSAPGEISGFELYGFQESAWTGASVNYDQDYPTAFNEGNFRLGGSPYVRIDEERNLSYFGNISYALLERYDFTVSIRTDKTNFIGATKDYREVPFWSCGFKWDIANEPFFGVDFINDLAFRITYGTNGYAKNNTSPYTILSLYRTYENDNPIAYISNPENPELTWEKTRTTNLGLDFSIFDERVSGGVEYYFKRGKDLLGDLALNSTYGVNSALMNYGKMNNTGIETNLSINVIRSTFDWSSEFNFSYNKNRVIQISSPYSNYPGAYLLGFAMLEDHPYNYVYRIRWGGLNNNGEPFALKGNGDILPYNYYYNDEEIEFNDLVYLGTAAAPYYGSFINEFTYKGLSLRITLSYQAGHVFDRNSLSYSLYNMFDDDGAVQHISKLYDSRWKEPGDENRTIIPRMPADSDEAYDFEDIIHKSDLLISKAAYISLDNVTLSYSFPQTVAQRAGVSSLGLIAQAEGAGLWVKAFNKGNHNPLYQKRPDDIPPVVVYSLGLSVSF